MIGSFCNKFKKKIMNQISESININKPKEPHIHEWAIEFFLAYPSICLDSDVPKINDGTPDRNIAPCITQNLLTSMNNCPCVNYGYMFPRDCACSKYRIKSNLYFDFENNISRNMSKGIFGDYYNLLTTCPDTGGFCGVAHFKIVVRVNSYQMSTRQRFNDNKLNYSEILKLWQSFYDKCMNKYHEDNRTFEMSIIEAYNKLSYMDCLKILTGYE